MSLAVFIRCIDTISFGRLKMNAPIFPAQYFETQAVVHPVGRLCALQKIAETHIANLTPRQRQVLRLVLAGLPSKNIAAALGISQRTVENHRASIMKKTGSKSIPALACLAFAASWEYPEEMFSLPDFNARSGACRRSA